MSAPWVILLLALSVSIGETEASHFRGGLITWRPVDPIPSSNQSNIPQIEISYRMSWRRSWGSQHNCTDEHIAGGNLLDGEGSLQCNCYGLNQQLSYVCTDFSETEDWTSGVSSGFYQPNIPISKFGKFSQLKQKHPSKQDCRLMLFFLRFSGCCWINLRNIAGGSWFLMAAIDLSVRNDTGRIKLITTTTTLLLYGITKNVTTPLLYLWLIRMVTTSGVSGQLIVALVAFNYLELCLIITIFGNMCYHMDTTGLSVGLYGVSIEIMDFATPTSTQPLSYIPLQFLVDVFSSSVSCLDQPVFIPPTRVPDSCVGVPENGTYHEPIIARTSSANVRSVGAQTCITLITGNPPPEIITIRPGNGEHTPLEDLQVLVRYDQAFVVPAQYLSEMTSYYILMESGAARTTTYCRIESAAIVDPNQLTFFVTQVPTTTASPNVTNKTATVTTTPNDDDDFGDEIVLRCGPTSFQIDIPRKLVEDSFETTGLYLLGGDGNPGCMSFDNHQYISLNSSLTGCGNQYTDNSTHSFYSNTVVNHDNNTNMIVEYLSLQIPFTCEYDRSKKLLSHFVTISEYIMKREKGSFVYDFAMYTDISYTVRYNTYPVEAHLGTNLFFRAELLRAADNLEIHLRSCRATPSP
ncbi:hypothetical protein BSL78_02826, partial [Apostichopus japonicus]